MSADPAALAAAMVASRFAAEDEARRAWLDEACRREERTQRTRAGAREDPDLCLHGHPLDGVKTHNGQPRRYCKTCNREAVRQAKRRKRQARKALQGRAA